MTTTTPTTQDLIQALTGGQDLDSYLRDRIAAPGPVDTDTPPMDRDSLYEYVIGRHGRDLMRDIVDSESDTARSDIARAVTEILDRAQEIAREMGV